MPANITPFEDAGNSWQQALRAFLAEKERRAGSCPTADARLGMLQQFFGYGGKTPAEVTAQDGFAHARGTGVSGRRPSSAVRAFLLGL